MKNEKENFGITLEITHRIECEVIFLVSFINDSEENVSLQFSGNVDEAARLSLCICFQGSILEPVEYRQVARNISQVPSIEIKPGEQHSFEMNGKLEKNILRVGRTSYIIRPGAYKVRFLYNGLESNEIEWNVK